MANQFTSKRRQEIVLEVRETNLAAQLFYQSQGFRAVRVLRNHYADSAEDAYVMQYRLDAEIPESSMPVNRIAQF